MKKQYLLQIMLWLLPIIVLSQSVDFTYMEDRPFIQRALGFTETEDAYVIAYEDYKNMYQRDYKLLKLNKQGEKLKEITIIPEGVDTAQYYSYRLSITDVFSLSPDTLCAIGSVMVNENNDMYDSLYMVYYDTDLHKIKEARIDIGETYQIKAGRTMINSAGNIIYYGGVNNIYSYELSEVSNSFALEIDPHNLTIIHMFNNFFGNKIYGLKIFDLAELPDGSGYICALPDNYEPLTSFHFETMLLNKDLSEREFFFLGTEIFGNYLMINEETYISTGRLVADEPTALHDMLGVIKCNQQNEKIAQQILGDPNFSDAIHYANYPSFYKSTDRCKTNDSLFYYTGNINVRFMDFQPDPSYILVNQLDLDLNMIWQTTIGEDEEDACYRNLFSYATNDGGVLLLNQRYNFKTHTPEERDYDLHIVKLKGNNDTDGMSEFHTKKSTAVLYPNPATDKIHIKTTDKAFEGVLEVLNMEGQVVLQKTICNQTSVSVRNLESGMYLYNLYNDNAVFNGKIVKK